MIGGIDERSNEGIRQIITREEDDDAEDIKE